MSGTSPRDRHVRAVVGIGLLTLVGVLVVVFLAALSLGWSPGFTVQDIEDTIVSWGPWGVAASMGLMVVHSFLPFPAEFLAIANGMVYGPVWGVVITWSGAMLGAFIPHFPSNVDIQCGEKAILL